MKILVLKNNINDETTINAGIQLAGTECKTIGLQLDFVQRASVKAFNAEVYSDPLNKDPLRVVPQQIFDEAKATLVPFDGIVFLFDQSKIAEGNWHPHDDGQIMQIPLEWYTTYPRVLADFIEHELCHMMFANSTLQDITHNQQLDPNWSNKQPHEWYLHLLSKFVSTSPIASIKRYYQTKETTGVLTAQNGNLTFACKSLELPWLNNQHDISCIPSGTYQVKWTFSLKFFKYTYEILNVPNRSGIRIHSGNYYNDLLGCIALGDSFADLNKDGLPDVANSRKTIDLFNNFFNKQPFTLYIYD